MKKWLPFLNKNVMFCFCSIFYLRNLFFVHEGMFFFLSLFSFVVDIDLTIFTWLSGINQMLKRKEASAVFFCFVLSAKPAQIELQTGIRTWEMERIKGFSFKLPADLPSPMDVRWNRNKMIILGKYYIIYSYCCNSNLFIHNLCVSIFLFNRPFSKSPTHLSVAIHPQLCLSQTRDDWTWRNSRR